MIEIKFKCSCMIEEKAVHVRYRKFNEDIAHWVEEMQRAIDFAHSQISPKCLLRTMEYAKIPVAGDREQPLGAKPKESE